MTELKTNAKVQPNKGVLSGLAMTHEADARAAATRVARESYGKLVAYLAAPRATCRAPRTRSPTPSPPR